MKIDKLINEIKTFLKEFTRIHCEQTNSFQIDLKIIEVNEIWKNQRYVIVTKDVLICIDKKRNEKIEVSLNFEHLVCEKLRLSRNSVAAFSISFFHFIQSLDLELMIWPMKN